MADSILNGILIFGVIQAVFFSLLFITKKNKELPDKIIAVWLFFLAINILTIFFTKSIDNDLLKVFQVSFTLIHGAFLYLYTSKLTIENAKFHKTDFLHFVPLIIAVIIGLLTIEYEFNKQKVMNSIAIAGIVSGITYSVLVIYNLMKHSRKIKDKFSFTEKVNLNWLTNLTIGIFVIWIGGSLTGVLMRFFQYDIPIIWVFTFIPVFIFYIGFYGIKQNIIHSPNTKNTSIKTNLLTKSSSKKQEKYKKSGLQELLMKSINDKLIYSMEKEQLFLNPTLSLSDLSEHLKIPAHHITQTLNEYTKQSFYDFVNFYRVKEFKEKVFAPKNSSFSLLGIAFDCGFNSKSSFNRIFKKHTGQSPSEYKASKK